MDNQKDIDGAMYFISECGYEGSKDVALAWVASLGPLVVLEMSAAEIRDALSIGGAE